VCRPLCVCSYQHNPRRHDPRVWGRQDDASSLRDSTPSRLLTTGPEHRPSPRLPVSSGIVLNDYAKTSFYRRMACTRGIETLTRGIGSYRCLPPARIHDSPTSKVALIEMTRTILTATSSLLQSDEKGETRRARRPERLGCSPLRRFAFLTPFHDLQKPRRRLLGLGQSCSGGMTTHLATPESAPITV